MIIKRKLTGKNSNMSFISLKINYYKSAKAGYIKNIKKILTKNQFTIIQDQIFVDAINNFSNDSIDVLYKNKKYTLKFSILGHSIYIFNINQKFTNINALKKYLDNLL